MARYGQNQFGENRFRIVFGGSRRFIVAGEWLAGELKGKNCASEELLYPQFSDFWVLEKWLAPDISRERWDIERSESGPYPERGDYYFSYAFTAVSPVDANLDKLISWIQAGEKTSEQDVLDGCKAAYEYEKKTNQAQAYDMIYDSLSAHLDLPMSGRYSSRGSKTGVDFKYTNRDLNLPGGNNKFVARSGRRRKVAA